MNLLANTATMTLKEITDLLDVRHDKAMIKVDALAKEPEFGALSKMDIVYNSQGQTVETYILDKRQSMAVSAVLNTALLMRVIDRWQDLESAAQTPAVALPDFSNPAEAARAWAEQYEISTAAQEQLAIAAPKVQFHDSIVNDSQTFSVRDAAKKIQQRPIKFGEWLKVFHYICLNGRAAQKYIDMGLFVNHTGLSESGHQYTQTRVTSKGCAYFNNKLFEVKL